MIKKYLLIGLTFILALTSFSLNTAAEAKIDFSSNVKGEMNDIVLNIPITIENKSLPDLSIDFSNNGNSFSLKEVGDVQVYLQNNNGDQLELTLGESLTLSDNRIQIESHSLSEVTLDNYNMVKLVVPNVKNPSVVGITEITINTSYENVGVSTGVVSESLSLEITDNNTVQALSVSANETTLMTGEQNQIMIEAITESNTKIDVTEEVAYSTNNSDVLEVSNTGLVTALAEGLAMVTIEYEGLEHEVSFTVSNSANQDTKEEESKEQPNDQISSPDVPKTGDGSVRDTNHKAGYALYLLAFIGLAGVIGYSLYIMLKRQK